MLLQEIDPAAPAQRASLGAFVTFALRGAIGAFALFHRLTTRQFRVALAVLLLASGLGLVARGG